MLPAFAALGATRSAPRTSAPPFAEDTTLASVLDSGECVDTMGSLSRSSNTTPVPVGANPASVSSLGRGAVQPRTGDRGVCAPLCRRVAPPASACTPVGTRRRGAGSGDDPWRRLDNRLDTVAGCGPGNPLPPLGDVGAAAAANGETCPEAGKPLAGTACAGSATVGAATGMRDGTGAAVRPRALDVARRCLDEGVGFAEPDGSGSFPAARGLASTVPAVFMLGPTGGRMERGAPPLDDTVPTAGGFSDRPPADDGTSLAPTMAPEPPVAAPLVGPWLSPAPIGVPGPLLRRPGDRDARRTPRGVRRRRCAPPPT